MLSEHETMCCAHCGPSPDGSETLVRIDCDGERMVVLLNAGWSFRFMVIGGPHLDLEVYCPSCSLATISTPTINNIAFTEPDAEESPKGDEPPAAALPSSTIHCPNCGEIARLHYVHGTCTGCDLCCKYNSNGNNCGCILNILTTQQHILHCPHCGAIANLHYKGRECIGCDSCWKESNLRHI